MQGANAFRAKGWIVKQGVAGAESANNLQVKGTDWRGGEGASAEGAAIALHMLYEARGWSFSPETWYAASIPHHESLETMRSRKK